MKYFEMIKSVLTAWGWIKTKVEEYEEQIQEDEVPKNRYLTIFLSNGKEFVWGDVNEYHSQKFIDWFFNPYGGEFYKLSFKDKGMKESYQLFKRSTIDSFYFKEEE